MKIELNHIGYGNPTEKQCRTMAGEMAILGIRPLDLDVAPPPSNSSPETFGELMFLAHSAGKGRDDKFVKATDKDAEKFFEDLLEEAGYEFSDHYDDVLDELRTFDMCLKFRFNRPRPFQLARLLGVPLVPMKASHNSPSYPSGHAMMAWVVAGMIANDHPDIAEEAQALAARISYSRISGGFHYPSDNACGIAVAHELLKRLT